MGGASFHLLAHHIEDSIIHRFIRKALQAEDIGGWIGIHLEQLRERGFVDSHRRDRGNDIHDDAFYLCPAVRKTIRVGELIPVVLGAAPAKVKMELPIALAIAVDHDIVPGGSGGIFDSQMGRISGLQIGYQDGVHRRIGFVEQLAVGEAKPLVGVERLVHGKVPEPYESDAE